MDHVGTVGRKLAPEPAAQTYAEFSANAALALIAAACSLLDRPVARPAHDFEAKGGFPERLYRARSAQRGMMGGINNRKSRDGGRFSFPDTARML